jgi:indolepyruvate ferredoxin oxidoreductase beta subunit
MRDGITNILVVGIGGQGVMTAAEMLARTALNQGYDVKKTEVAGMAQRGGVVSSHVRFGPKVYSPQIDPGEADLLIGFEAAESLRWLPYLRPTGVAMVNTLRLLPPVVSAGLYDYPADPIGELAAAGIEVHAFDAGAIAEELGNPKLVNTIMLGAISDYLPFPADALKECIVEGFRAYKPKLADINAQAFDAGRQAGHAQAVSRRPAT